MHTETYTVQGMTCGSCIAEVMELVRVLPGVSGVTLGYTKNEASPMLIESRTALPTDDLRAALETGGFHVSGTSRRHVQHLLRKRERRHSRLPRGLGQVEGEIRP